ncbi:unnamed protein product, partial [Hymenolepis diminuta]
LSHDEISYLDKPTAASEERGKRKSVQISDGKQLDEEDEEAQPTTSREKRRLSRGSCANSDLDETQTTNGRGKRRRVSRRSYADYDYDDYVLHACDECDKSYPTYHGLLIHQGRNHKQSTPIIDNQQENRESKNVTDVESQAEDSNLFVCNDCNKTFDTYHGFLIHAGRYHKSAENVNSEERTNDPKVHIESGSEAVEIDISTYSCDGCDKSFHTEHGLLIHTGRAHHRSSPSRKRRRKSIKKAAQGNRSTEVIDVDNEPTDGNGQIAETTNGADPAGSSETPEVNERTQSDADAAENNEISEVNEPPADPPADAPPEEYNETSGVNEQTVNTPNDTAPMENSESKRTNDGPLSHDSTTTSSQHNDLPIRSPSSSIKRNKLFECEICGKTFSSHSNRRNHIDAVHNNLRLYACPMCDKTYKFRRGWRRHIYIVHKNLPPKNRQRLSDGKARNRPKPFSCDNCDQRFSCLSHRREHIDAVHKKLRQHPCPICGRRFLYSYDVPKHINIIHKKIKPYKCDTCGMSFTYFTQRKSHIDIVHKKLKQYICSNCNQSFNCRADLCKHGKEAHLGPFPCLECGKVYKFRRSFNLHVSTIHKGLRLHKCEICEKTYPDKATLKKHVRFVHEGVKNYTCESCGKGFPTASVYRLHVNVVHRGIKPFKCEFCQKSFATPAKCRRHVNAIHQNSESILTRDIVDSSRSIEVMDLTTGDGVVARADGNTSSPSPTPVEVMDLTTNDDPRPMGN